MDVCLFLSVVCCQRSSRRADHSSKGVLPSLVCLCVISEPQKWDGLDPSKAVAPQEIKNYRTQPKISVLLNL
jgi:hypothetical protein